MNDSAVLSLPCQETDMKRHIKKTPSGKIKISAGDKSSQTVKYTMIMLLVLTAVGFLTFDYKNIDFTQAIISTLHNIKTVFFEPKLTHSTVGKALWDLLVTFSLGLLSTFLGAVIALFASLLCAKNISKPGVAAFVKGIVALIRAIPTILWALIFAVSAGLGSVAAVAGLTFHSAGYLVKAYAESIEEMDYGTIEALKSCGASYWQIVFQAIWPSSITYMLAWTFMRLEINFINAVAVGAAAGSGGIGYSLWMSGSFYLDLHEMGFITYLIVISVIILEAVATKIKAKVK